MSDRDAWQLAHDAAVAYEKDFVPAVFAQWPPVLAEVAEMKAGDRVLDVACGTGILAREAADRVGPTGSVTGLDLNEAMLAVARRLRPEIDWRQGDAGKLPFADGAFDVVVSQFALMFFSDQTAALREMWRVLAPRGRLAVAVCAPMARTTPCWRSSYGERRAITRQPWSRGISPSATRQHCTSSAKRPALLAQAS
jgi:ubiquinone/menaquinone biosynthesis C-methylase UbiE